HEVLVHHADTQRQRMAAVGNGLAGAVDADRAAVSGVEPIKNGHQGGFAGPVFADNTVDGAASDVEIDILVRLNGAKALVDLFKLDRPAAGWGRSSGRFRPLLDGWGCVAHLAAYSGQDESDS